MRFSKHYAAEEHAERIHAISAKAYIKVSHGSSYVDIAGARASPADVPFKIALKSLENCSENRQWFITTPQKLPV